jgi:hypothetical protein
MNVWRTRGAAVRGRRRAARWGGATVALLVAVALLAPAASLAADTFSYGPGSVTYARLQATHGYGVNFSENDKGYFFVRVKGHGSTTDFTMKTGRAPDGHLIADFGKRGRFDLRFVPVGRPEPIPIVNTCKGPKGSWQPGYLVGRARFRTERGYAQVHIHRVSAAEESWSHLVCAFSHLPQFGHPKEKRTSFAAVASSYPNGFSLTGPKRTLTFRATQFYRHARPADRRVALAAELKESGRRVSIDRKVAVAADERSLRFPGAPRLPEEVAVKPPAPFTGSADFLRTRESTFTWSGNLAVTFPGLHPIRLTGPRFGIAICALKGCVIRGAEDDTSGS